MRFSKTLILTALFCLQVWDSTLAQNPRQQCIDKEKFIEERIRAAGEAPCLVDTDCAIVAGVGFGCYPIGNVRFKTEIAKLIDDYTKSGCIIPPPACRKRYSESVPKCIDKKCKPSWN